MKVVSIVGARPQFIKLAMVSNAFRKFRSDIEELIVHTGQHFDKNMSQVFFAQMGIPEPHFNLNIGGGTHGQNTGRMLEVVESKLIHIKPDWVVVYGDTDSTLAGALAAAKLHIPVAHVESGLRSYNKHMPEELNRILTDNLSSTLFCPSQTAMENLQRESLDRTAKVVFSGDVMFDAIKHYTPMSQKPPKIAADSPFILVTCHRAENTDNPKNLLSIFEALTELARDHEIIFPVHPRTQKALKAQGLDSKVSGLQVLAPASYFEMLWLLQNCSIVLTDSGGLQKEAYFLDKPCVTLREQTEWMELLQTETHVLSGANTAKILSKTRHLMNDSGKRRIQSALYGFGDASEIIAKSIE